MDGCSCSAGTSADAEVYDPVGNDFTPVGDMEVAHGLGHQAVKLADGRVLVVAGDAGTIQPSAIAEVFDPATDEFTRVGDLATPRMLHFAVLAAEGKVLVGGGQDDEGELLDSVEIYDPAAGTFSPAPARGGHGAGCRVHSPGGVSALDGGARSPGPIRPISTPDQPPGP